MAENLSHSSNSTLSSHSGLTSCTNSGWENLAMKKNLILPSTSNLRELQKLHDQIGYPACLAAQYGEDIEKLQVDDADHIILASYYCATSGEYMSVARANENVRLNTLRNCLRKRTHSSNQVVGSSSSRKKERKS